MVRNRVISFPRQIIVCLSLSLMLLASTCLYSSSYRVFIKSNGNYDLKGKKFYIALKDSSEINKDESVLQASYEDYLECATFISRALELQGGIQVTSKEESDYVVDFDFNSKISDEWSRNGGGYSSSSVKGYGSGVLIITRNKNMENVTPVTFQNGRDVSQVYSSEHSQVVLASANLGIKAYDSSGKDLWSSAISLKSRSTFSEIIPIMVYSSLGKFGVRVNNQDYAVSDEEPAFKLFCTSGQKDGLLFLNPACSSSNNDELRFILKYEGKILVGVVDCRRVLKYKDYSKYLIYLTDNSGRKYQATERFSRYGRTFGLQNTYFEFPNDFDTSALTSLVFEKRGKEVLSFTDISTN
ncbi:MAG: hypothetical protein IJG54_01870 [Bacteroidales bacterium]|nr:hypothetical protein [Bacteroidales bacterium]